MTDSKIEWTDRTWNPIRGCTRESEGCRNCYAERIAARFSDPGQPFHTIAERTKSGPRWTGKMILVEDRLDLPLRWKKPAKVFVNSMFDLFHENIPDEWIDRIFAVMARCPHHTFQVPTKRAKRMREWAASRDDIRIRHAASFFADWRREDGDPMRDIPPFAWPLPNVWLGVSVEDQERADERIPELLATPAAKRFISAEPLLGPLDIVGAYLIPPGLKGEDCWGIDWVIAGGESGPGARPMHPDWARSLRDQCKAAGVPFFFKQWGEWIDADERASHGFYPPGSGPGGLLTYTEAARVAEEQGLAYEHQSDGRTNFRIRKGGRDDLLKRANRLLDGREWNEFPP